MLMKHYMIWCIMPCSRLKVNRRFGEIFHLKLQDRRISQGVPACCLLRIDFLLGLFSEPEDVPRKRRLALTDFMALYPTKQNSSAILALQ
jgi:hypothetical protein